MRVIDFHVHLPSRGFISTLRPYLQSMMRYFRSEVAEKGVDEVVEELRRCGVSRAVLLPLDASRITGVRGDTNELMSEIQERNRDFFTCFATIDPGDPEAPERLEEAITRLGLRGVKLHPQLQLVYPNDAMLYPLYEVASRLKVPFLFHTGTSGVGAGVEGGGGIRLDYGRPIYLDEVAASFPRLKVVMAHFGWPWAEEAIAIALHKRNVYLELSGWLPRYIPPTVIRYVDTLLRDKTLFGSDYPMINPKECIEQFQRIGLREETLERLLYRNAAELLGL